MNDVNLATPLVSGIDERSFGRLVETALWGGVVDWLLACFDCARCKLKRFEALKSFHDPVVAKKLESFCQKIILAVHEGSPWPEDTDGIISMLPKEAGGSRMAADFVAKRRRYMA